MRHWVLSFLALLVFTAAPAHADTIYSYVSDPFRFVSGVYEPGTLVTGTFVLPGSFVAPVQEFAGPNWTNIIPSALRYSFTDGHQTLTEANSTATIMMSFDRTTGQAIPAQSALVAQYSKLPPMEGWFTIDIRSATGSIVITTTQDWAATIWLGAATPPQFHQVAVNGITSWTWDDIPGVSAGHIESQFGAQQMGGYWGNWTVQTVSVPEPMSLLLVVAGVGGLVAWRAGQRHRRDSQ